MKKLTQSTIALITDFGQNGFHYVASMKGVILGINPIAKVIDVDHNITPFSVLEAAYILKTVFSYFPERTIFVIVVDPGVGSNREIIAIKTRSNKYLIGPNNGIFTLIHTSEEFVESIIIKNPKYFHKPVSQTFHGRDIMAPIASFISLGVSLKEFGTKFDLSKLVLFDNILNINHKDKIVECTIQYIDSFGNCTTNIALENNRIQNLPLTLEEGMELTFQFQQNLYSGKYFSHFEAATIGELLYITGSTSYLEISVNKGNAAKLVGLKVGDVIAISF
ncbi:MAG: S-adenosyl-l-methionine hydroxide adenosyltransferase family protein [Candidatus Hermodarchaeota archaeon]